MAGQVNPGGHVIFFDLFTPFDHQLEIMERRNDFPHGQRIVVRSYGTVIDVLEAVGFTDIEFHPFNIPIDLATSDNHSVKTSYSVKTTDNRRMSFRGAFFQPWCHLVARKK